MMRSRAHATMLMLTTVACCLSVAAGDCVTDAPGSLSAAEKRTLCAYGAPGAAECARQALKTGGGGRRPLGREAALALCSRSPSGAAPATCAAALPSTGLDDAERVALCSRATDEAKSAAACLKKMPEIPRASLIEVCGGNNAESTADCFVALKKKKFSLESKLQLCKNPSQDCALSKRVDELDIVELCAGGGTKETAECFGRAPNGQRAVLCGGVRSPSDTDLVLSCAKKLAKKQKVMSREAALFCREKHDADCVLSAVKLDLAAALKLCSSPSTNAPKCHSAATKKAHLDPATAAELCRGAVSTAGAECAAAVAYSTPANAKLLLCRDLSLQKAVENPKARAKCFGAALRAMGSLDLAESAARLCSSAVDEGPADCLSRAQKLLTNTPQDDIHTLCRPARAPFGDTPVDCALTLQREAKSRGRSLSSHRIAAVCAGSINDAVNKAVAGCVRRAPSLSDDTLFIALCSSRPVAEIEASTACVSEARHFGDLDGDLAAALCASALPANPRGGLDCASRLKSPSERIQICAGALDVTPALCAAAGKTGCRGAVSRAATLEIVELRYDGKSLGPREAVHAAVAVLDDYGQRVVLDINTLVAASIAQKGSNGCRLFGSRVQAADKGVATFSISFSIAGNFTLRFRILDDREDDESYDAAALVHVREDPLDSGFDSPAGRCGHALFSSMQSSSKDTMTTTTAFLGASALSQRWLVRCSARLRLAGFVVSSGWGGATWLSYRTALTAIEASLLLDGDRASSFEPRVPTVNTPLHDVMGLPEDATPKQIKKAYHRLSLQWHPDRWVGFPHYIDHVTHIFEIIANAHRVLTNETQQPQQPQETSYS